MADTQNVRTIKNAYDAFMRGDIQTILDSTTEDIQWTMPGEGYIPTGGLYRGHDGVRRFFQTLSDSSETLSFEPREYIAQGERVIVLGSYRSRIKTTGKTCGVDWAMSFTFRNGKISVFTEYTDTAAIAGAYSAKAKAA